MNIPSNIIFSNEVSSNLELFFNDYSYTRVAILVDENTKKHCYPIISRALPNHIIIEIQSGEEQKNLKTCQQIWGTLTENAFDRKSLVVNLGGGVIGDMGGFCAATYKRGIDFINIPTTLLAQVDASIGGKLGIDFQNFKNHIGVFRNPLRVFLDGTFFKTLPEAELRSGYAEIIKHCLIKDKEKFEEIINIPYESLNFFELTKHSVQVKNDVVLEDPTEKGFRKILNFGHTIGHAIESFYLEKPGKKLLHGEAIAIGMICESFLSMQKRSVSEDDLRKITKYILELYRSPWIPESDIDELSELTRQDKKNEGNKINSSLLNTIGDCDYNVEINQKDIKASIAYFNEQVEVYTK
jgi:3-dehydroquinate synthase